MENREEIEVKIAAESAATVQALLAAHGFTVRNPRVFEQNIVLDDTENSVKGRNLLLRVRAAGDRVTVTFKGKEAPIGIHKRRVEREFQASDLDECLAVFAGLGFTPALRYDKYRTEFARGEEAGIVTLDETPIGTYMELEGPADWIDTTARQLGFSAADYVNLSYARLFERWCTETGVTSNHMSFR